MVKLLFRALVVLFFFALLWFNVASRVITFFFVNIEFVFVVGITSVGVSSYFDYFL